MTNTISPAIANMLRNTRNEFLAKSDWTQLPDCGLSAEDLAIYTTYRQALRDFPSDPKFPNIAMPMPPK